MKKECRNCKAWIQRIKHVFTGICTNKKSPEFNKEPLYDSKCNHILYNRQGLRTAFHKDD